MRRFLFACVVMWLLGTCVNQAGVAQQASSTEGPKGLATRLEWTTDAVAERFVAVHGRRALVMGYPQLGLEVWAYPLQLVSDYQISFIPRPGASALDGLNLLRRIEYRPEEVIRTYVGPDFVVRETIFVP